MGVNGILWDFINKVIHNTEMRGIEAMQRIREREKINKKINQHPRLTDMTKKKSLIFKK